MNETEKIELGLLGRALFGKKFLIPETIDWEDLYKESEVQTISLIIYDSLTAEERSSMPEKIQGTWNKNMPRNVWANEQILAEQTEVIRLLKEQGIPCAILKGSSSAAYYPLPHLRVVGDIDLLVKPEQQMAAVRILQSHGYGEVLDEEHPFHKHITKGYVTVEIHKEPNGISTIENEILQNKMRDFFRDAVDRCQYVDDLPFLSDTHQAIVLILHKMKHFLGGDLGLRQLCDWAMFVDGRMTEKLWHDLKPVLQQFGLLQFTGCITRSCIDYLGLSAAKAPWAMEFDAEIASEIIERIVQSGNFGRKENAYAQRYFVDASSSNRITSFIKLMIPSCKYHWPICDKYPILLPIAPFVIYGKYLKLYKEGKRPKIEPLKLFKKAKSKQNLYQKIAPFVVEQEEDNQNSDESADLDIKKELMSLIRGVLHNQGVVMNDVEMSKDKAELIMRCAFRQGLTTFLNEYSVFRDMLQESSQQNSQQNRLFIEVYQHVTLQEELKIIFKAFEENQISCVLLKGMQTCEYYPKPELRSMGDIDLLYLPEQTRKVQRVLEELGYLHEGNTAKHDHYKKNRIIIEMHKTLCVPEWKESEYFRDIWNRVVKKENYQYVYEMTLEDHYLFTFTHLLEHFQDGGIGIRMVLDIFVLSQITGINWDYINQVLEQLRYTKFHSNIQRLAMLWFSEETTGIVPEDLRDLERYIIQGGIFGSVKNSETNVQLKHKGRVQYIIKLFFPSYEMMCTIYPWLRTRLLLPIAWVHKWLQILIHRREVVTMQFNRAKTFDRNTQEVEERKEFFEKIGLY